MRSDLATPFGTASRNFEELRPAHEVRGLGQWRIMLIASQYC